uniref:(northern house mosquito) hypothetical protein n=1 Tax=Culex pipiens TaxID=7175 RepID=A0A8D8KMU8_CULPI
MFHRDRLSTRAKPDPETVRHTPEQEATSATRHTLARLSYKDLLPDSANGLGCLILRTQKKSKVNNKTHRVKATKTKKKQNTPIHTFTHALVSRSTNKPPYWCE